MAFQLLAVTKVIVTNANPRSEFHGKEHVRAIDLSFRLEASNEMLDDIEPGLCVHHFTNKAAKAGQDQLPEMISALPNLRHPRLPTEYRYAKDEKPRGYRLEFDQGLGDRNIVLDDCVRASLAYEIHEGGSTHYEFTISYNGEVLNDDATYGRLCALPNDGEAHILLRAPLKLELVKGKNWRSGKPDTPAPTDNGAPLLEGQKGEPGAFHDTGDGSNDDVLTPEKALARGAAA